MASWLKFINIFVLINICYLFIFSYVTRYFGQTVPPKSGNFKRTLDSDSVSDFSSTASIQPPPEKRPHKEFLTHAKRRLD